MTKIPLNLSAPLICDAIKIAYRQSKDGFVVSFAIHPQDMPAELANADIGSQWQMRLVGLDEDGNPKEVMPTEPARATATPPASADPLPKPVRATEILFTCLKCEANYNVEKETDQCPVCDWIRPGARKRAPIAPDKRLTQRAGIMCTDHLFQTWLRETNAAWKIMNLGTAEQKAAEIVRVYCGVKSRKEIVPGSTAAILWDQMLGKYAAWQLCLEDAS